MFKHLQRQVTNSLSLWLVHFPSGSSVIMSFYLHICGGGAQSRATLCDPMDWSPPGSSVHGVLQASILEWAVSSFSRGAFRARNWTWISHIVGKLFTIWATREAPFIYISTSITMHTYICPHICMERGRDNTYTHFCSFYSLLLVCALLQGKKLMIQSHHFSLNNL